MEDLPALLLMMMGATVLLWALPACGDEKCVESHRAHMVASRVASIEKEHATWHGTDRPDPLCSLCAARKRDQRDE